MDPDGTGSITFTIHGPISRDELPALTDRICALLAESDAAHAICHCHDVAADAVTADALARLQLAARRRGCRIKLRDVSPELRALIALMGLTDVLPEVPPEPGPSVLPESPPELGPTGSPEAPAS